MEVNMRIKDLLIHDYQYLFAKEDWFPPLKNAIDNLDAKNATWKPEGASINTIEEITSHMLYYQERLNFRLKGIPKQFKSVSNNEETFTYSENNDWKGIKERLYTANLELQELLIAYFNDKTSNEESLTKEISGVLRHNAYHIGQIIQIRKLQGSWHEKRIFNF